MIGILLKKYILSKIDRNYKIIKRITILVKEIIRAIFFFIFIISFSFLIGCKQKYIDLLPINNRLFSEVPPGPFDYQQGWIDGCRTGLQRTGDNNIFWKMGYKGMQGINQDLANNSKLYLPMYNSAYVFCALYASYQTRNFPGTWVSKLKIRPRYFTGSSLEQLIEDYNPDGPPNFKYGWKQGCTTGKAATGKMYHKIEYTYQKDYRYLFDKEYNEGWSTAFWFCERVYDIDTSSDRKLF